MSGFKKTMQLFLTFLKIGAFTFGGGYAMIPIIKRELVDNKKWIEEQEILDVVAIAESTPGPIAINSATFVGYKIAGFWGAFFCTLGVVLPSFIIISIISVVLGIFQESKIVAYAFFGIRAGVLALLVNAFMTMFKHCPKEWPAYTIAAFAFILSTFTSVNMLFIIIGCALLGVASFFLIKRRASNDPS